MAFYKNGEKIQRPGIYMRFVNIEKKKDESKRPVIIVPPDPPPVVDDNGTMTLDAGILLYSGDAPVLNSDGVLIYTPALTLMDNGVLAPA